MLEKREGWRVFNHGALLHVGRVKLGARELASKCVEVSKRFAFVASLKLQRCVSSAETY